MTPRARVVTALSALACTSPPSKCLMDGLTPIWGTHNISSHAHFSQCRSHLTITHLGVVQGPCGSSLGCVAPLFHRPLFDVPDPFPSFCSTPPPSTPNSLLMTGTRRPFCATPPGGLLFGHLAEPSPLVSYEPKTSIDVSSEHTPRGETASTSRTMTSSPKSPSKTSTVYSSKRQTAVARSKFQQVW